MEDDIAGLQFTLETEGFERFETACTREESSAREYLLGWEGIEEAMVLQTCQRYELYVAGSGAGDILVDLLEKIGLDPDDNERLLAGDDVVEHLFRVASGLESGVLGEDEVLGQLRTAYSRASDAGALSGTLGLVVLKALRVGERARTETAINEGRVSLGSVAVERARTELRGFDGTPDELEDCSALVIGAGDVAGLVVKAITNHAEVDGLIVANRTVARARELAGQSDAEALALDELDDRTFAEADLLVSTTAADDRILTADDLRGHELVALDLANPRDIATDVEELPAVRLVRIDEVLSTREEGLERRESAIPAVEGIIESERERLGEQLRVERVDDTLGELYARAHSLRQSELEEARTRLAESGEKLTETQARVVADFSETLINKLLHPKTAALREAAASGDEGTVDAWLELFERASGNGPGHEHAPGNETGGEESSSSDESEDGERPRPTHAQD